MNLLPWRPAGNGTHEKKPETGQGTADNFLVALHTGLQLSDNGIKEIAAACSQARLFQLPAAD